MKAEHIAWSRNQFDMIALNGVWLVPRSGLIFRKTTEDTFNLIDLMPWMEGMGQAFADGFDVPPTKEKLLEYQRSDFASIKQHFNAAGIQITDTENLLQQHENQTTTTNTTSFDSTTE